MKKIPFFVLFFMLVTNSCFAQADTIFTKEYSVSQLQEDLNYWRDRLEKKLPILYLYKSKEAVDKKFDSIYNAIDHPLNELEFYKMLTPLTTFIQDGHNSIMPSEPVMEKLRNCNDLFPFDVRWINNKLFIYNNFSTSDELLPGTEIITINNISVEEMLHLFLLNLPREGENDQYIYGALNQAFRFYYFVYYGLAEKYTISYKNLIGAIETCTISGTDLITMKIIREKSKIPDLNPYHLHTIDSLATAILTIKTFDQTLIKKKYSKSFKRDFGEYFNQIKNAKTTDLIIDLRGNMGGNPDYVKYVLQHLIDKPFVQAIEGRIVNNGMAEDFQVRTKKQWFPFYGIGKFDPKQNVFSGNVYVITDESTFSAGVILASTLKKLERATVIGNETGGNPVIMSGFFLRTTRYLPNTKLQVTPAKLATIYNPIESNSGRGLIPDHTINLTQEDLNSNKDVYLNFVLELIKASHK